jgi:hypothetical protein
MLASPQRGTISRLAVKTSFSPSICVCTGSGRPVHRTPMMSGLAGSPFSNNTTTSRPTVPLSRDTTDRAGTHPIPWAPSKRTNGVPCSSSPHSVPTRGPSHRGGEEPCRQVCTSSSGGNSPRMKSLQAPPQPIQVPSQAVSSQPPRTIDAHLAAFRPCRRWPCR